MPVDEGTVRAAHCTSSAAPKSLSSSDAGWSFLVGTRIDPNTWGSVMRQSVDALSGYLKGVVARTAMMAKASDFGDLEGFRAAC